MMIGRLVAALALAALVVVVLAAGLSSKPDSFGPGVGPSIPNQRVEIDGTVLYDPSASPS